MATPARYYSSTAVTTTLASSIGASDTSLQVASSSGFPSSYPFTLILEKDSANEEIVTVTSLSGSSYQITRGVDGTAGRAHAAGTSVEHGVSALDFTDFRSHEAAAGDVHDIGSTSDVVGTNTTQTLTNKTLTSPTINTPTVSGGTITGATITSPVFTEDLNVPATSGVSFEGDTDDANETRLIAADPTADRTVVLPDASDTLVGRDTTDTLTNKTLTSPDVSDPTVTGTLTNDGLISGGTVDATVLRQGGVQAVTTTDSQTLTNKTLTAPTVNGGSVDAASLSQGGVQAVTVSDAQTLTNKSMSGAANTFTAVPQAAVTDLVADLASKESVANVDAHKADTAAHGATGAVVGTTNSQTLTNKTLTNPTINGAIVSGSVASSATITGGTVDSATVTGGTLGSALNANSQKITSLGTPSAGTDAATKAYVDAAVAGVLDSAPGALDTLNELAAALGDDPDFATTVTNSIATRVAKAGDTVTGDLTMSGGATVTGLPDPSVSSDAVNLNYLNTLYGPLTSASASATAAAASAVEASGYADDASGFADDAALSASQAAASLGFMPIDGGSATSVYGGQLMTIDGGVA